MKLAIIIPAHNEEHRIGKTLQQYTHFFDTLVKKKQLQYEIIVVINNTRDNTERVVTSLQKNHSSLRYLVFKQGGKGFAITEGFKDALKRKADVIGFVDADNATQAPAFYDLVLSLPRYDGVIANRYDPRSKLTPPFTFRRLVVARIFNFLVRALFRFPYPDTQCGAKVFTRELIEKILPQLTLTQWAYDIDLLYVAQHAGYIIHSGPTEWEDVEGSKLRLIRSSLEMFLAVFQLRLMHSPFRRLLRPLRTPIGKLYRFMLNKEMKRL